MSFDEVPPLDDGSGESDMPASRRATVSFVLGVAAFVALFVFPFASIVLGIPAATNGILARRQIDGADGAVGGKAWAEYGLAAGVVSVLFAVGVLTWDIFT